MIPKLICHHVLCGKQFKRDVFLSVTCGQLDQETWVGKPGVVQSTLWLSELYIFTQVPPTKLCCYDLF